MSVSSEVCVLVGLGENIPGSVVECVGNFVKCIGFIRFHFFTYLVNWMISNRLVDLFSSSCFIPRAFFSFLRVWGVGSKIDDFLGIHWRDTG